MATLYPANYAAFTWDGEAILGPHQTPEEVVPNKYYMGRVEVTGAAITAAQGGAFVRAVETEMGEFRRAFYAQMQAAQGMQNQAGMGNYANLMGNITATTNFDGIQYGFTPTATFTGGLIAADGFDHYPTAKLPTVWERLGRAVRRLPLPRPVRRLMGLPFDRRAAGR